MGVRGGLYDPVVRGWTREEVGAFLAPERTSTVTGGAYGVGGGFTKTL
jgi:hypothetical protein